MRGYSIVCWLLVSMALVACAPRTRIIIPEPVPVVTDADKTKSQVDNAETHPDISAELDAPEPVQEILPGILAGYLSPEMFPDSLALLAPPPIQDSAASAADEAANEQGRSLRGTPRWEQAAKDAELMFPEAAAAFSGVLNIDIAEANTPHLYMLLRRVLADAGLSTYAAKNHYVRKRPFIVNGEPTCTPDEEDHLKKDGSYPSGHTAIGWAWALVLVEIFPKQADAILKRGWEFGQSRVICNVHWQSDVDGGRIIGSAVVARLHSNPGFLKDLDRAKREVSLLKQ